MKAWGRPAPLVQNSAIAIPFRAPAAGASCTLCADDSITLQNGDIMTDRSYHVYVIQGRGQRDYSECQAALDAVPAKMTALPFIGTEDAVIEQTRDADALVVSSSPVTRGVMGAL